jgi:hypothetical protein
LYNLENNRINLLHWNLDGFIGTYCNYFCLDSSEDGEVDRNTNGDPVRLRQKRYVKRRDRAVNNLRTALDSSNYNSIPVQRRETR